MSNIKKFLAIFVRFISFFYYINYDLFGDERVNLNELIDNNKDLVYSIVYRFKTLEVEDLFQVGCVGLIKAYNNYNSSFNTKFTTYAYSYILGEIYHYINSNRPIKVNNDYVKLYQKIKYAEDYLTQQLCRVPSDIEISNFLEIDLLKLTEIRNMAYLESLDYNYDNNTLYDVINVENLDKETLIDLKNALSNLSNEERDLIIKHFFYNKSQDDLAKELNTNQVKVSRILKKTLGKMKIYMN